MMRLLNGCFEIEEEILCGAFQVGGICELDLKFDLKFSSKFEPMD
jgi:hypothetical protein